MSLFSQFKGGRPAKVEILAGSGSWTPPFTPCLVRCTLVGGGAGGQRPATVSVGRGGGAGATVYGLLRVASGTVSYVVGAAGTGGATNGAYGTSGGNTYFAGLTASGGQSSSYIGGGATLTAETDNQVVGAKDGGLIGFAGGGGGASAGNSGSPPGYPLYGGPSNNAVAGLGTGGTTNTNSGGPAGGDSVYGTGGNGGNGSATTGSAGGNGSGFGSGGGAGGCGTTSGNGGNGAAGTIILEIFPSAE